MEFIRRRLGLIVRALVSILLIAWLVRKVNWPQLWAIVREMNLGWLFASFICFTPVILIVSWRWRLLMSVHGVRLPFWRIFELNMIGQFFSAFLLGTTGGDVFKIFYAARAVPERRAAVAFTVVVDRAIGMMALLFFGVALSFTQLPLLLSTPGTRVATGSFYLFAVGGLAAAILGTCGPILLRHASIRSFIKKLPFIHRGTSIFAAYEKSALAISTNLTALAVSLPSHLCVLAMGYSIISAMHRTPPLLPFCSILLMVNMLIALPVSISGFGVREGLFIMFFGLLHIDRNHAFAFSLTFFALNLFWSLIGGPFYFLYRHQTHTPAPSAAEVEPIFSQQ
jgi:uncharacterized membrane protein YbhN (UPF0104 family)